MTPEEARAYFNRWKLVREEEAAELQRTPMDTKLRQLAALMASRHLFGPEPDREAQIDEVRARWARLRQALAAHPQVDVAEARSWIREFATAMSMSDMLEEFDRLLAQRISRA